MAEEFIDPQDSSDEPILHPTETESESIANTNRFTSMLTLYYEPADGDDPDSFTPSFTTSLRSDDEPYKRKITIGPEWQQLETGWAKGDCYLLFENKPKNLQQNPNEEELKAFDQCIVEVYFDNGYRVTSHNDIQPHALVELNEFMFLRPASPQKIWLRSRYGSLRCFVTLIPR